MKQSKKKPTASHADTSMLMTDKEHYALSRIRCATAGEDPGRRGLEYIGRLLDNARANAENAATRILPGVADVKLNPAPAMQSILATVEAFSPPRTLAELCEIIFDQLKTEAALKPDFDLLRTKLFRGETRLETFASDWLVFLFGWNGNGGLAAFMRKKIELAQALGKPKSASKLLRAFNALPPDFTLTDWTKDTKRLANEITPDDFHRAFRTALKLDAEATDEINSGNVAATKPIKERKRYPQDTEALNVLQEAARRKASKSYHGDSNTSIIKRMIEEPQSKWSVRVLFGKLKGKAGGRVRERKTPRDSDKAAETWGKHLSAYLKDHTPKQGT